MLTNSNSISIILTYEEATKLNSEIIDVVGNYITLEKVNRLPLLCKLSQTIDDELNEEN